MSKKVTMTFSIREDLKDDLKVIAEAHKMSMSKMIELSLMLKINLEAFLCISEKQLCPLNYLRNKFLAAGRMENAARWYKNALNNGKESELSDSYKSFQFTVKK